MIYQKRKYRLFYTPLWKSRNGYLFALSLQIRSKKLDPYLEKIVGWLKEHPDLTEAQVYDWLKCFLQEKGAEHCGI